MSIKEEQRLLRMNQLLVYIPISRGGVYRKMKEGLFPKQIKIGGSSFWKLSEIQDWIEQGDNWKPKAEK